MKLKSGESGSLSMKGGTVLPAKWSTQVDGFETLAVQRSRLNTTVHKCSHWRRCYKMDIRILESHACNFNVVREHPAHLFSEEPTNAIIETDVELKKKKIEK